MDWRRDVMFRFICDFIRTKPPPLKDIVRHAALFRTVDAELVSLEQMEQWNEIRFVTKVYGPLSECVVADTLYAVEALRSVFGDRIVDATPEVQQSVYRKAFLERPQERLELPSAAYVTTWSSDDLLLGILPVRTAEAGVAHVRVYIEQRHIATVEVPAPLDVAAALHTEELEADAEWSGLRPGQDIGFISELLALALDEALEALARSAKPHSEESRVILAYLASGMNTGLMQAPILQDSQGRRLSPAALRTQTDRLKVVPYVEVDVSGSAADGIHVIQAPAVEVALLRRIFGAVREWSDRLQPGEDERFLHRLRVGSGEIALSRDGRGTARFHPLPVFCSGEVSDSALDTLYQMYIDDGPMSMQKMRDVLQYYLYRKHAWQGALPSTARVALFGLAGVPGVRMSLADVLDEVQRRGYIALTDADESPRGGMALQNGPWRSFLEEFLGVECVVVLRPNVDVVTPPPQREELPILPVQLTAPPGVPPLIAAIRRCLAELPEQYRLDERILERLHPQPRDEHDRLAELVPSGGLLLLNLGHPWAKAASAESTPHPGDIAVLSSALFSALRMGDKETFIDDLVQWLCRQ